MSERGSFVTEYIYCDKCFEACKEVLCGNDKWLKGVVIPSWLNDDGNLPIIAGKIGGSWNGEEFCDMENEYIPQIQEKMCSEHKIRICVLSDNCGNLIFEFDKNNIKTLDGNEELKDEV